MLWWEQTVDATPNARRKAAPSSEMLVFLVLRPKTVEHEGEIYNQRPAHTPQATDARSLWTWKKETVGFPGG